MRGGSGWLVEPVSLGGGATRKAASAQQRRAPAPPQEPEQPRPFGFWAEAGFGVSDSVYDNTGTAVDTVTATAIPLAIGAWVRIANFTPYLKLSMMSYSLELTDTETASVFGVRDLTLGARFHQALGQAGHVTVFGEFGLDLGTREQVGTSGSFIDTSNDQHALRIGAHYGYDVTPEATLRGMLDFVTNFGGDGPQDGFVIHPQIEFVYRFMPRWAAGIQLAYLFQEDKTLGNVVLVDTGPSLLHLTPWVQYRIPDAVGIRVAAGLPAFWSDDYVLGIPLVGESVDIVYGATVTVAY